MVKQFNPVEGRYFILLNLFAIFRQIITMKILLLFGFLFSGTVAFGQLDRTQWKGVFNIPDPSDCILQFSNDTLIVKDLNNNVLEAMKYQIKGDTLVYTKLYGISPCSSDTHAFYKFEFKENKLFLSPLNDDCDVRRESFPQNGLTKFEQ